MEVLFSGSGCTTGGMLIMYCTLESSHKFVHTKGSSSAVKGNLSETVCVTLSPPTHQIQTNTKDPEPHFSNTRDTSSTYESLHVAGEDVEPSIHQADLCLQPRCRAIYTAQACDVTRHLTLLVQQLHYKIRLYVSNVLA